MRLLGKVAVITGGARGMGAAHARRFIEEGAKVFVTDILEREGVELAEELGPDLRFIRHDVTQDSDWTRVVDTVEEAFGPISVLVNNAGVAFRKLIPDVSEAEYRRVIDTNQLSVFLGMRAILPSMRRAGGGSIVNISSIYGLVGSKNIAYVAAKFAVRGMTKAAALEFAEYGIRVNSVHPGVVLTPMVSSNIETAKSMINETPLKRGAEPVEISNLVLFLASDESSYSTGAEFVADGGMSAM